MYRLAARARSLRSLISEIVKASSPQGLPAEALDVGHEGLLAVVETSLWRVFTPVAGCAKKSLLAFVDTLALRRCQFALFRLAVGLLRGRVVSYHVFDRWHAALYQPASASAAPGVEKE